MMNVDDILASIVTYGFAIGSETVESLPVKWHCNKCGLVNSPLNRACAGCKRDVRPYELTELQKRAIVTAYNSTLWNEWKGQLMATERNEELHGKFFNNGMNAIKDMNTVVELDAWLDQIELIAYEARAMASAGHTKRRTLVADLAKAERDKLISRPDFNSSERSKLPTRNVTKADKIIDTLAGLGVDASDLAGITANLASRVKPVGGQSAITKDYASSNKTTFNAKPAEDRPVTRQVITNQETLLADISSNLASRINDEPIENVVNAAKIAANIARKVMCRNCGCVESVHRPASFGGCPLHHCSSFTKVD